MLRVAISASPTLMPFSYRLLSSSQRTVRPVLVVVAAINSTTASRLVRGRPRQFCVIGQNRRCSILFHFDVPGAQCLTTMVVSVLSANFSSPTCHSRTREPLDPPPSQVIIRRSLPG